MGRESRIIEYSAWHVRAVLKRSAADRWEAVRERSSYCQRRDLVEVLCGICCTGVDYS